MPVKKAMWLLSAKLITQRLWAEKLVNMKEIMDLGTFVNTIPGATL
jgi:hypothetical protein